MTEQSNILLPLYIQKQIIKIICVFINKNYKEIEPIGLSVDYRDNEAEIKQLTLKVALVCHDWFKTLKNNLNVSVDFNFKKPTITTNYNNNNNNNNNNNYYSIIDINNIEILKLHYDHNKPTNDNQHPGMFYEMIRQPGGSVNKYVGDTTVKECDLKQKEREIPMETVNEQLKLLSQYNLKKLIFRNINADKNLKILNSLYPCEALSNVHCLEFEVNSETTIKDIQELKRKVKKLFSIIINDCTDMNVLLECFKTWSSSIKQFYIVSLLHQDDEQNINQNAESLSSTPLLIFNLLSGIHSTKYDKLFEIQKMNKINYFSNIQFFEMYGMIMTLEDLTTILKSSNTSIQHLSISICLDKLVYFLDDRKHSHHRVENCDCNSIIRNTEHSKEKEQFNLEWAEFSKQLEKCNKLKVLSISHECGEKGESLDYESEFVPSFTNGLVQLLSLPKSLEKFGITGSRYTGLFYEIADKLKSVTHFSSTVVNTHFHSSIDFKKYVGKLEHLVLVNPHIQQFRFSKFEYVRVNDLENEQEIDPLEPTIPINPFEDLDNEYTFKEIILFDYQNKKNKN